ncbi:MAG: hypothetical protein AAFR03_03910 [Pseudomonadota bacterium]
MNEIQDLLMDGEEVLWEGRPKRLPRKLLLGLAALLSISGIAFVWPVAYALHTGDMSHFENASFEINGEQITADTDESVLRSGLWISVLVLAPYTVFGIGWVYMKSRELYAVTSERLIVVSRFPWRRLAFINPSLMPIVELSGGKEIGSLSFRGAEANLLDKLLALYRIRLVEFTNIHRPGEIQNLIAKTFNHSTQRS